MVANAALMADEDSSSSRAGQLSVKALLPLKPLQASSSFSRFSSASLTGAQRVGGPAGGRAGAPA